MSYQETLQDLDEEKMEALARFLRKQEAGPGMYGFALKRKGVPGYLRQIMGDAEMQEELKGLKLKKTREG